jgi:hypothetical protein
MSGVRIVFPKLRLSEIINQPGGPTVAEALARADANLEIIRPACLADLMQLLETCEGLCTDLGDTFDDAKLAGIYAVAVKGVGAGAVCARPGVDEALGSFCDLLDNLRTAELWDREAIEVHVRAWRLLASHAMPPEAGAPVLAGLRKVTAQYAV